MNAPARRSIQFRLSTAMVLVLIAGGLAWIEFRPSHPLVMNREAELACCGWPWTITMVIDNPNLQTVLSADKSVITVVNSPQHRVTSYEWMPFNATHLALDIGVCLVILLACGAALEFVQSRRKTVARNPTHN